MKPAPELTELSRCLATEIATLTNRLVSARAQEVIRSLDVARRAVEAAATPIDPDLNVPGVGDEEIQRIKERLASNPAVDVVRKQLQERGTAAQRLAAALKRVKTELATTRADLDLERQRRETPPADVPLDALLMVFNSLSRARTSADMLTCVMEGLARQFSRVGMFDVHSNRLEGVRQVGFNFEQDVSKLRLPVTGDSLLALAIASNRVETFLPALHAQQTVTLPFGGTPACAIAIPFVVQGDMAAIIYADDAGCPDGAITAPQARATFAELVHQHAALLLRDMRLKERAAADVRKFSALLTDEMEYGHSADMKANRNTLERQQGLRHKLEVSRQMHGERANHDVAAESMFEDHLAAIVDKHHSTIFGSDLAAVLGIAIKGPRGSIVSMRR